MRLAYLAQAYSHELPEVRETRFQLAVAAVHRLEREFPGVLVYSPIIHYHHTAVVFGAATDAEFYALRNMAMLERCDMLILLDDEAAGSSKGVAQELRWAESLAIPIIRTNPEYWDVPYNGKS